MSAGAPPFVPSSRRPCPQVFGASRRNRRLHLYRGGEPRVFVYAPLPVCVPLGSRLGVGDGLAAGDGWRTSSTTADASGRRCSPASHATKSDEAEREAKLQSQGNAGTPGSSEQSSEQPVLLREEVWAIAARSLP